MKLSMVKKTKQYDSLIKEGKKTVNTHFVCYCLPSLFFSLNETRVGISVGKKLGNAVFRNKYKRIIRSIIRQNEVIINDKYVIIIMRPACINEKYEIIESKLNSILKGV